MKIIEKKKIFFHCRLSRKLVGCISCLFFTIGIVIIFVTILSFSFLFRSMTILFYLLKKKTFIILINRNERIETK